MIKNADNTMDKFPTAADVLQQIDHWSDISERRCRDLKSTMNLLKRVYGRPLETIRMNPDDLAKTFLNASPAALRLKPSSLGGYRSSMRAILRHLGLVGMPRRLKAPIAPVWQVLRDALPDQFISIRLQAFMGFCSDQCIRPEDVNEETIVLFLEHLRSMKAGGAPSGVVRKVVNAWARAQSLIPAWPDTVLVGPNLSKNYAPPMAGYPAALQVEVEELMQHLQTSSHELFAEGAPAKPLKPASIRLRRNGIKYALAALVQTGMKPAELQSLSILAQPKNVETILDWHWRRAGKVKTDHLATISAALRLLATHSAVLSDKERERVLALTSRAKPKKRSRMEPKREGRLRQLEDPDNEAVLLHLPRRIMFDAAALKDLGQLNEAAWLAGVAVAIAIELRCPMRIKNLSALELGRQLLRLDSRGKSWTHIIVEAEDVKNDEPIRWRLSRSVADLIDVYVDQYRIHLTHHSTPFLFPNRDHADRPRVSATLGRAMTDAIFRLVGIKLTPHDFRAFAGWQILKKDPGALDDLRVILGHRTLATTLAYYTSSQPARAADRYNALIDQKQADTASRADILFRQSAPTPRLRSPKPTGAPR
jgi:integrase